MRRQELKEEWLINLPTHTVFETPVIDEDGISRFIYIKGADDKFIYIKGGTDFGTACGTLATANEIVDHANAHDYPYIKILQIAPKDCCPNAQLQILRILSRDLGWYGLQEDSINEILANIRKEINFKCPKGLETGY